MRKISLNPRIGVNAKMVFDGIKDWIVVIDEFGIPREYSADKKIKDDIYRYSLEQLAVINNVNHVLEQNGKSPMTEEEIEYLLYPFGKAVKPTTEELQALAGFRVEKTIVKVGA